MIHCECLSTNNAVNLTETKNYVYLIKFHHTGKYETYGVSSSYYENWM